MSSLNKGPSVYSTRPCAKPTGSVDAPLRSIKEVVFGVLSPEEILKMSVTPEGIHIAQAYDTDGVPLEGGLMDPRLGAVDKSFRCLTCQGLMGECMGHFGHIRLFEPVYHVCFLSKVLKILRCICYFCYKLLVRPDATQFREILVKTAFPDRRRFQKVYELCKGKNVCDRLVEEDCGDFDGKRSKKTCGHRQPKYKLVGLEIFIEWTHLDEGDANRKLPLLGNHAREILENISDDECINMGMDPKLSRPEWMIATVFVVPPITVRPIAVTFNGAKNQDDLTYKLADIVNANNDLIKAQAEGLNWSEYYKLIKSLQYHVATLVDNDLPGVPTSVHKSTGKQIKSLKARLKGKEGRIRGNLMGKRVDFSARTVISPDPCLKVDEVGVPKMIAQNLTYPETVTKMNLQMLENLVDKGAKHYPGAKVIVKPNGDRVDLRYIQRKFKLQPGYKVERDLVDGDLVVFNRQPTLHKMSMMGHRIKVLPHSTFRMNLSCTTPYNADFDGDEMNLHVPQSLDVKAEVENLHLSTRNIITPQSNRPVMGIVQDSLTGAQKLTRRDTFIEKDALMNLLMHVTNWDGKIPSPAILKPCPLWTGKQLFSLLIPGRFNLTRYHSTHSDDEADSWISTRDTKVIIDQGELILGILCRNTLGTASGSLLHVCMMELGHEVTGIFYNDIQNLVNDWLRISAHSIGIKDCIIDPKISLNVQDVIQAAKSQVCQLNENEEDEDPKLIEQNINSVLNNAMNEAGRLVQNCLDNSNRLKAMVSAGSKGSLINIAQITACIGQLNVEGKRIARDYGDRTLPIFQPNDNSPESRGFVENSFFRGLEPHEYYFQCMAGREGLIDTAVKTAETGYIQRRLMKAMESIMVQYDGTVRNAHGQLIEFCYGEDGLAGEKVEFQTLPTLPLPSWEFRNKYKPEFLCQVATLRDIFAPELYTELVLDLSLNALLDEEFKMLENDRKELRKIFPDGNNRVALPCNLMRMITNLKKAHGITKTSKCTVNPRHVIEKVQSLVDSLKVSYGNGRLDQVTNTNATFLFACLLRSMLCTKEVCERHRLTVEAFQELLCRIEKTFQEAKVEPGEMVGAIAAQSIGEPATQMTLNTFHFAGVSSKNVTLGIPRLKEIINLSKNPKSPSVKVYLEEDIAQDEQKARKIACKIKCTTLESLMQRSCIFVDENLHCSVMPGDQMMLDSHLQMPSVDMAKVSKTCLRIELNRKFVFNEGLTMEEIATKINAELKENALCLHSDDNAEVLFLRLFCMEQGSKSQEESYLSVIGTIVRSIRLKGLATISDATVRRTSGMDGARMKMVEDDDGALTRVPEWIIETDGTAMLDIMCFPNVDFKRVYSNDIWDVYNTLGIEAARKVIEMELRVVLQTYGLYVNYRHLSTLCSVMTSKGYLMPITRYGVNRQGLGPLMRCSFEETADVLIDAAVHSERDYIRGVSEHIVVGQMPRMGTGAFDVLVDTKTLCPGEYQEISKPQEAIGSQQSQALYTSKFLRGMFDETVEDSVTKLAARAFGVPGITSAAFSSSGILGQQPTYSTSKLDFRSPTQDFCGSTGVGYNVHSPPYQPMSGGSTSPSYSPANVVPLSPDYSPVLTGAPKSPSYSLASTDHPKSPSYSPVSKDPLKSPSYNPAPVGYSMLSPPFNPLSTSSYSTSGASSYSGTTPSSATAYSPTPTFSSFFTANTSAFALAPFISSSVGFSAESVSRPSAAERESSALSDSSDSANETGDLDMYDPFSFGQSTSSIPRKKQLKKEKSTVKTEAIATEPSETESDLSTQDPSYSPFAPTFQPTGSYNPKL